MHGLGILDPMFALACWTVLVLLLIPFVRVRSGRRKEIVVDDFKYGESPSVPSQVSISNRNLMNLLELPILFYVVCLVLYVTAGVSALAVSLAWAYVVLRIVHSVIHLTYNRVMHRLAAFAISNAVLVVIWVLAGIHIASIAQKLPSPSRAVFKCEKDGKVVYSDSPCLGAQRVDVEPTRGLNRMSGTERIGTDVRQERHNEMMADTMRPVFNETAEQRW
jgi:hypothetical protein